MVASVRSSYYAALKLDGQTRLSFASDLKTFSDMTIATAIACLEFAVNAMAFDERYEHFDAFRRRRPTFPALCGPQQRGAGTRRPS